MSALSEIVLILKEIFLAVSVMSIGGTDNRYCAEPDIGTSDIRLKGAESDIMLDQIKLFTDI
jgi:hypothetical protein